ncbi:pyrroline-5-carboxylate reductase-like [Triticum dicoccoides]|uniref:pyrroline-5-carboxylate reductase-like n=1 Tax=Triticum dicoccoides TaxID=85692 RepID=UPI00188F3FF9|nr:pyrroline-5-carboxylate reductase-like [Triticum dicoccoides]XP_044365508.1 pyrroline-5-carboxylate reductase-like [Triticum aestivum]
MGNLAESIACGVAASGVLSASAIRTTVHRHPERCAAFASLGATILASNAQVVEDSDVIVISIKPQIVKKVLVELKPLLSEEKLLVSITAAIKNERFTVAWKRGFPLWPPKKHVAWADVCSALDPSPR